MLYNLKISGVYLYIAISLTLFISCGEVKIPSDYIEVDSVPLISPDYTEVTIPSNIAPLNFIVKESGDNFIVHLKSEESDIKIESSEDGVTSIDLNLWREFIESSKGDIFSVTIYAESDKRWRRYSPFTISVDDSKIDGYVTYRKINPGYELWSKMGIYQRDLSSFEETPIVENSANGGGCVNCHSYCGNRADKFMFHSRGDISGTVIGVDGSLELVDISREDLISGAVYPHWHPSGRYIAFSVNNIMQYVHLDGHKYVEVSDSKSDIIIYDVESKEIIAAPEISGTESLETFPCWSADGEYLYFTEAPVDTVESITSIRYNLSRVKFNEIEGSLGTKEILFNAVDIEKSISFPRLSLDGESIMFTMSDYGNFSIWHQEADLYLLNLKDEEATPKNLSSNSSSVDSYHSWSSNSDWFIFSSKRYNGMVTHLYISKIDSEGNCSKPFMLPRYSPIGIESQLYSFNIPELTIDKVQSSYKDISDLFKE